MIQKMVKKRNIAHTEYITKKKKVLIYLDVIYFSKDRSLF